MLSLAGSGTGMLATGRHEAVVDELEDDEELEYEQAIFDDYDDKVTYITVHLNHLTNREETSVSVKHKGETQQLLHKRWRIQGGTGGRSPLLALGKLKWPPGYR